MKYFKILLGFLLCFFGKEGISQQHLTKTWSFSTGIVFNAKGGNTTAHYHLNSFDELRLNYYDEQTKFVNRSSMGGQTFVSPTPENELSLKTRILSLEFSKGYKYKHFKKATTYFGMGFFWGKEKIKDNELLANNLFGISTFLETEYAPLNWCALFARFKLLIPTVLSRSKNLRLAFGCRFYF